MFDQQTITKTIISLKWLNIDQIYLKQIMVTKSLLVSGGHDSIQLQTTF